MRAKNTSSKSSSRKGADKNRTALYGSLVAGALVATGVATYFLNRSARASGTSSLETLPPNPTEDVFGNHGEENMVEPLTLREDQILMRDRMNPYNGLF